jgi:hypothetical protein
MASTKFKKHDKNRFRKVYPYLRVRPITTYCADKAVVMEIGIVTFTNSEGPVSYSFTEDFASAPVVTSISADSESNDTADVNIFVESVSKTVVQFSASQNFTGTVHFHAILIPS